MSRFDQSLPTVLSAVAAALVSVAPVFAQQVSDARVKELMKEALVAAQATSQAQTATPAPAGPTTDLTMDEAVKRALDQNNDIAVQRLNPQIQDLSIAQILGAYRPTLSSTVGDTWNRNQGTSQLSGGQNIEVGNTLYNAGLSQNLRRFGSAVSLTWTNSRQNSTSNNATINPLFQSALTASITQPLIRNFKIDNNRQQLQTAQISRQMADVNLRATVTNTVANVRNAYWDLVYAIQAVDVARTSLQLAQKLVEDNQTRVEIGTMAPIDVVQAQSQAASANLALVQAEANRKTAELALKRLIVGSTQDPLWNAALNPVDRPPANPEPINLEAAVRHALDQRTDLVVAREQLQSNDVTVRYLHNQLLPQMDLVASYAATGKGGTGLVRNAALGGTITREIPGGYLDALSFLRQLNFPSWNVQVNISYPLGTSAADANYARAKIQVQQSQAQIRALELQVATDVTNAALQVQNSLEQVQSSRAARELAQKQFEAEQSKFEVGMSTNYLVVQTQRDLATARNNELQAILNYRKSLVNFERVQFTTTSGGSVTSVSTGGGGGGTTTTTGTTRTTSGGSGGGGL